MKDPLLQEYTLEELAYEYYLVGEQEAAKRERAEKEADKIEEEKLEADMAWADAEEAREAAELAEQLSNESQQNTKTQDEKYDPLLDPKNIEWMQEEIEKNKLVFGDDFGEDLNLDFSED